MIKKLRTQLQKGFTILEMLMVLAIFTIITAIVIFNYGEFNSKTILSNMAYEVALSVRQAQVYSLGVRGQAGLDNFNTRYGIHLNIGSNDKTFVFFVDKNTAGEPDNQCDATSADCLTCSGVTECLEKISLVRDVTFARICTAEGISNPVNIETGYCSGGEDSNHSELTLLFKRPNPESIVTVNGDYVGEGEVTTGIVLKTSYGGQRAVIISPTGQITVQVIDNASE